MKCIYTAIYVLKTRGCFLRISSSHAVCMWSIQLCPNIATWILMPVEAGLQGWDPDLHVKTQWLLSECCNQGCGLGVPPRLSYIISTKKIKVQCVCTSHAKKNINRYWNYLLKLLDKKWLTRQVLRNLCSTLMNSA